MIQNPTPITTGTFNGMWISNIRLKMPDLVFTDPVFPQSRGSFTATLLPYDGNHILASNIVRVTIPDLKAKRSADYGFDAIITSIIAEAKRQSGQPNDPVSVIVYAPDPTKLVSASFEFPNKITHMVKDCYALCSTDSTFASVFISVMGEVAKQAGLPVS